MRTNHACNIGLLAASAKNGRPIDRYFRLPEPEDHTVDFDTALDMLEWEVGETVELDERTFRRLVRNEWAWRETFAANTASYVEGSL